MGYANQLSGFPLPAVPRRKVFISSYHGDRAEVNQFLYRWATQENVFIPKALCTFDNDDFINSNNPEYIMSEIRRKYIGDASVTIVLVGKCTHSRRYVDWEIKSSLRRGENVPNGLLAYVLPSALPQLNAQGLSNTSWPHLPSRLNANWIDGQPQSSYARYYVLPATGAQLRQQIELAFSDRTNRAALIKNDSEMMKYNARCTICGVTH